MVKEAADIESTNGDEILDTRQETGKKTAKWAYVLGIFGVIATILMAVAVVVWNEEIRELQQFGYVGAFVISVLGGATVIIPVPALAVVFTLGGVMEYAWLVGISSALGELVGALTIYMTGHGAGRAISNSKHGKIQRTYEKLLGLMERRGPIVLFIVA